MQTIELSVRDYRLTTAEILYHLPDFPALLQTYIWHNVDAPPKYPRLHKFLEFWEAELEGKLHSGRAASSRILKPHEVRHAAALPQIH